ncbi:TIGR04222 domain-containing membrane protein [Methylobacterium sp. JK268]
MADSLDWTGPPLVALYGALACAALVLVLVLRSACRGSAELPAGPGIGLLDLAYLAAGPQRAADLVALALVARGGASVAPAGQRLLVWPHRPPLPAQLEPLRPGPGDRSRAELTASLGDPLARLAAELAARGVAPAPARLQRTRLAGIAILGAVVALGAAGTALALARGRPAGPLALLTVATGLLGGTALLRPLRRTRAGDRVVRAYRARQARAARAPRPDEVLFAFAVSGVLALAGTDLAGFAAFLRGGDGSG